MGIGIPVLDNIADRIGDTVRDPLGALRDARESLGSQWADIWDDIDDLDNWIDDFSDMLAYGEDELNFYFGEKIEAVGLSVQNIFGDDDSTVIDEVLAERILGIDRPLVDAVKDRALNGHALNVNKMFNFVQDYQGYKRGLPNVRSNRVWRASIPLQETLDAIEGKPVTIEHARTGRYRPEFYAWSLMVSQLGYDFETNTFDRTKVVPDDALSADTPVYLDKVELVIPTADSALTSETWKEEFTLLSPANPLANPSSFTSASVAADAVLQQFPFGIVVFHCSYINRLGAVSRDNFVVDLAPATRTETKWYMVRYSYLDDTGKRIYKYWEYAAGTGTYPGLDDRYSGNRESIDMGDFYPPAIVYTDSKNITYEGHQYYGELGGILKAFNLTPRYLSQLLLDTGDANKIETAAIQMGVPITSQEPACMQYLFDFFDDWYEKVIVSAITDSEVYKLNELSLTEFGLTFRSGVGYGDFEYSLSCAGITRNTREGFIVNTPGTVRKGDLINRDMSLTQTYTVTSTGRDGQKVEETKEITLPIRMLRRQLSTEGSGIYQEIVVVGLRGTYPVRSKDVTAKLDDARLLIPLRYQGVMALPVVARDTLIRRSIHIMVMSRDVAYGPWYADKRLRIFMMIALITATIMSAGAAHPLVVAYQAGMSALIIAVIKMIVINLIIQKGIELVARELNPDLALVLAIVAIIYGGVTNGEGFINSTDLLMASSNLAQVAQQGYAYELDEIQKDYEDLLDVEDARQDQLNEVRGLLDNGLSIDPMEIVALKPYIILNEKPESFFDRTVHAGNIGAAVYDYLENFHDESLRLPGYDDYFI